MYQFTAFAGESRDQCSFDSSPGLFAAFHARHRLLAPRHPPRALRSLATLIPASSPDVSTRTPEPANQRAKPQSLSCRRRRTNRLRQDIERKTPLTLLPNCQRTSAAEIPTGIRSCSAASSGLEQARPLSRACSKPLHTNDLCRHAI